MSTPDDVIMFQTSALNTEKTAHSYRNSLRRGSVNMNLSEVLRGLQSRQVKRTPLDYINELIISKLNPFVVPNNAFISKMFESKFDC